MGGGTRKREREGEGRTVDDPGLDLRGLDLQRGRDRRVGHVAADVLEAERREGKEADLVLQL